MGVEQQSNKRTVLWGATRPRLASAHGKQMRSLTAQTGATQVMIQWRFDVER